jgi:hypothetical protein
MDRRVLRDLLILIAVVIIAAIGARILASGETLTDYAKKNPETALVAGTSDIPDQESSMNPASQQQKATGTSPQQQEASMNATPQPETSVDMVLDSSENNSEEYISADTSVTSTEDDLNNSNASTEDGLNNSDTSSEDILKEEAAPADDTSSSENPNRITYADGFYYEPIPDDVFNRISGISYPEDCSIPLDDLRYVVLQYIDFGGNPQSGELICNKDLAQDFVEIFYELYNSNYQVESIKLVDEFGGDDTASMLANNTSCFNYRVIPNTTRLSNHAKGRAIDINPFYNPYITYNKDGSANISPVGSEPYADRSASFPYKIDENDLAYKLFISHGFTWGGNWNSSKDYQHFEKK